jgi:hypothetical protein
VHVPVQPNAWHQVQQPLGGPTLCTIASWQHLRYSTDMSSRSLGFRYSVAHPMIAAGPGGTHPLHNHQLATFKIQHRQEQQEP